jgi:hypothetical protein
MVQRLRFAAAELEVVGEIAKRERETGVLEELRAITKRVKACINRVANGKTSSRFPRNQDPTR